MIEKFIKILIFVKIMMQFHKREFSSYLSGTPDLYLSQFFRILHMKVTSVVLETLGCKEYMAMKSDD